LQAFGGDEATTAALEGRPEMLVLARELVVAEVGLEGAADALINVEAGTEEADALVSVYTGTEVANADFVVTELDAAGVVADRIATDEDIGIEALEGEDAAPPALSLPTPTLAKTYALTSSTGRTLTSFTPPFDTISTAVTLPARSSAKLPDLASTTFSTQARPNFITQSPALALLAKKLPAALVEGFLVFLK
jgi:hypothetical protein